MIDKFAHRLKLGAALAAALCQAGAGPAAAFCGFYVAQADSKLFNTSSKVILARDGDETAITMASDIQGDAKQFAVVVPVPTFIERKSIGIVDPDTIDHLDAYTAPRLVEYYDKDPCRPPEPYPVMATAGEWRQTYQSASHSHRGVTVEASYDVGEYDVSILSATESDGLVNYLTDNGYKIPDGAAPVLSSYIKQKMHFFIAKVNLDRMKLAADNYLHPLQVRYTSAKFMLPLRLGTVNASGPQDLIVYALTHNGRVEAANYPNVKLPSGMDVPLYVKDEFGKFYKAMFDRAVQRQDMRAILVEYAWSLGSCDPCSAKPMSSKELVALGARWIGDDSDAPFRGGAPAFVTRLHVRYNAHSFPEDIAFLETQDRENFQARYVLRHPWRGEASCPAAEAYRAQLPKDFARQGADLADLTGWPRQQIDARMEATGQSLKAQ